MSIALHINVIMKDYCDLLPQGRVEGSRRDSSCRASGRRNSSHVGRVESVRKELEYDMILC